MCIRYSPSLPINVDLAAGELHAVTGFYALPMILVMAGNTPVFLNPFPIQCGFRSTLVRHPYTIKSIHLVQHITLL